MRLALRREAMAVLAVDRSRGAQEGTGELDGSGRGAAGVRAPPVVFYGGFRWSVVGAVTEGLLDGFMGFNCRFSVLRENVWPW